MLSMLNRINAAVTYVANSLPTGSEFCPGADYLQQDLSANLSENLYSNTSNQATGVSHDAESGSARRNITSPEDTANRVLQLS